VPSVFLLELTTACLLCMGWSFHTDANFVYFV